MTCTYMLLYIHVPGKDWKYKYYDIHTYIQHTYINKYIYLYIQHVHDMSCTWHTWIHMLLYIHVPGKDWKYKYYAYPAVHTQRGWIKRTKKEIKIYIKYKIRKKNTEELQKFF